MSENIDIRIREDGSRVVARNLNDAATGAEKADKSITGLNKTLANSSGAESATAKLKAMIRMAEMYGSGLVKSLDQTTNGYRNSLMKHFEMVSKEARASAASIKSQMEALTAAPVNMNELNAYYRKQEALAAEQAEAAAKRVSVAKAGLLSTFGNLVPAARSAGESQQFWNDKARDAHSLARGLSGSLGQLWLTYGSIAPLLAGAALGSAFVNAAKSGSELSYSLQFVKSLGGESQIAIDKLRESTIALSKESQYGPAQIADGYRILAQAGLDATQSLAVMPNVLALATTGEMTM